jgi:hypothetical protein
MQVLWLFGGVIAFTIVAVLFTTRKERRRSQQLCATATRLGLTYRADGAELRAEGLAELPLLALGVAIRHRTVSNVLTGTIAGVSVIAFDYAYWTGSLDKQRFDYAQTVVCFRLEADRYPAFALYPRSGGLLGMSTRMAGASADMIAALSRPFGKGDARQAALDAIVHHAMDPGIDIGASAEFSSAYRVMGTDRDRLARVVRVTAALDSLVHDGAGSLSVECSGQWLAVYRKNHLAAAADLQDFLQRCVELKKSLFAA